MAREENRMRWRELMADYERSGKKVSQWCEEVGCTRDAFNYWRYRVRIQESETEHDGASSPARWLRADVPSRTAPPTPGIAVAVGGVEIKIVRGFDRELLREAVEALS
jgi:hypothetical protein